MTKKTITAIVPMRHSSERVPGKNYRNFGTKPLYQHIVDSLLNSEVDKVVIDTDSELIIEQTVKLYPTVIVLRRPEHLRDGSIPMNDVLLNCTEQVESDFYLQTHSTNPLLKTETINRAINTFHKIYPVYDSLFSVTKRFTRYWDSLSRPINHNANILLRTQDLPPVFEENSSLYIFDKSILKSKHNRIGNRPYLFEMEEIEAQDIDVELNFLVAEFLYHQLNPAK